MLSDTTTKIAARKQIRESETDLAGRIFALQRRNNRDRTQPPPTQDPQMLSTSPRKHLIISRPEADADDFSRRLKISVSPPPSNRNHIQNHPNHAAQTTKSPTLSHAGKLFNPNTDSIPLRHTAEPEVMSDTDSYARGGHSARQLFNPRKDDPVRFSVLARPSATPSTSPRQAPTPKSSGEYVSASSTSSYATSTLSSSFTLSSTTDGSSAGSGLFEKRKEPGNDAFAGQLKRLYRTITTLEAKIIAQHAIDEPREESARITLKGKTKAKETDDEGAEQRRWLVVIAYHKALAESIQDLLEISLNPALPASLRDIPTRYNIIIRLWTHGIHTLLETLRRASFTSPLALEHLIDFIYYAYSFYTGLLEESTYKSFRSNWLEALGDLARYRMAVAAMVNGSKDGGEALTAAALSSVLASGSPAPSNGVKSKANSTPSVERLDGSPSPSVGLAAAKLLDLEPEKDRWRIIARDWYGLGLTDTPGTGKLHHHLGLLSRDLESEEMRGVYHFVKSMTALHPFHTSRESILPLWSAPRQSSRAQPDARVSDLFVLLHGMLFTHIQLDDFQPTLARLLERLEIDGAEEREWIMMAVINLCAVLEYGKPLGVLRRAGVGAGGKESGPGMMRVIAKKAEKDATSQDMDVDEPMDGPPQAEPSRKTNGRPSRSPAMSSASTGSPPGAFAAPTDHDESPISFRLALQLTFTMLRHVLRHPMRKASAYAHETVNPYLTVLLTFLATVCKQEKALRVLERSVPWQELATFLAGVPRQIMLSQGLDVVAAGTKRSGGSGGRTEGERWSSVTSGCAPLDEDWCLRGMEWVRRAYDRGFWKYEEGRKAELEVLDKYEAKEATDGVIESADDDDEDEKARLSGKARKEKRDSEPHRRWIRIVRCAVGVADAVDGFRWVVGSRDWVVEGTLAEKVEKWKAEEKAEQEEERRRTRATRWVDDDSMEVDDDEAALEEYESEQSEDDEMDSDEVKALKARRRYLRTLLQSGPSTYPQPSSPPRRRAGPRKVHHKQIGPRAAALNVVPGYTVLVVDTNILLSSLSMFASLVESLRWTVLVPLPVIMELDGLSSATTTALAQAATSALTYVSTHVRTHALSLKVQTSKGNYLPTLSVRRELVEFGGAGDGDWERNMDDLILKSAIWQDEHWVDRSALLKSDGVARDVLTAVKVVLLSLDRNLRLKARSRQLPAASEKDLASILAMAA